MPSDASINLKTSAAAALCARLLVHPLDIVKVTIQYSHGAPAGLVPRLGHLLTNIQQQLYIEQKTFKQHQHPHKHLFRQKTTLLKGLYKGAPFAVLFQVPALALFLSTYDATKHGLDHMAHLSNLSFFRLHHFETHLISGMLAKATGTLIWTPMIKLQSLAIHPTMGQAPLTLKDVARLFKHVCRTEGVTGLWSGYGKNLTTLLPYTMLYFATYEQLKQSARRFIAKRSTSGSDQDPASIRLGLGAYMMCVSGAVVTSSAICQTSTTLRERVFARRGSVETIPSSTVVAATASRPSTLSTIIQALRGQPQSLSGSLTSPTKNFPSALSVVASTSAAGFRMQHFVPTQFKALMSNTGALASQALPGLPWQQSQHATLTTTSALPYRGQMSNLTNTKKGYSLNSGPLPWHPSLSLQPNLLSLPASTAKYNIAHGSNTGSTLMFRPNTLMTTMAAPGPRWVLTGSLNEHTSSRSSHGSHHPNDMNKVAYVKSQKNGILRTIARGLGPRILWTVPGVTLTTAGFEVFRNKASVSC